MLKRIPKRKWVKKNGTWYFISVHSRLIWAKVSGWIDDLPDNIVQKVNVYVISHNKHHIKAECCGFDLDEAKKFAESVSVSPFPEKLTHTK